MYNIYILYYSLYTVTAVVNQFGWFGNFEINQIMYWMYSGQWSVIETTCLCRVSITVCKYNTDCKWKEKKSVNNDEFPQIVKFHWQCQPVWQKKNNAWECFLRLLRERKKVINKCDKKRNKFTLRKTRRLRTKIFHLRSGVQPI